MQKIKNLLQAHNFLIAPSILSADFARLGEEVEKVITGGADMIHVDVMDNHYVPNLTVGPLVCKALREHGIQAPLDVHLMVQPVDSLISEFAKAGASIITFHPEASLHVNRTLQLIHDQGCKVGLALNPATPLSVLEHVFDKLDMILLMSVNPGFAGQSFIPSTFSKLKKARELIAQHKPTIRLEVDGGITVQNIAEVAQAGADTFVAGTAIFKAKDYTLAIANLREALKTVKRKQ